MARGGVVMQAHKQNTKKVCFYYQSLNMWMVIS